MFHGLLHSTYEQCAAFSTKFQYNEKWSISKVTLHFDVTAKHIVLACCQTSTLQHKDKKANFTILVNLLTEDKRTRRTCPLSVNKCAKLVKWLPTRPSLHSVKKSHHCGRCCEPFCFDISVLPCIFCRMHFVISFPPPLEVVVWGWFSLDFLCWLICHPHILILHSASFNMITLVLLMHLQTTYYALSIMLSCRHKLSRAAYFHYFCWQPRTASAQLQQNSIEENFSGRRASTRCMRLLCMRNL